MTLTIPEALMLLSRKNDTGEKQGQFVEYALAGGALAELVLRKRLVPQDEAAKKFDLVDTSPTGDSFLDGCLAVLESRGSGRTATRYVQCLAGKSKLMREQAKSLVRKGVLEEREKSFLIFNWTNYPERDSAPEAQMVQHLEKAIAGDIALSTQDRAAIALADKTGLLRKNFDKALLSANKKRIKSIAKGAEGPTKAAMNAIDAVIASIAASTAAVAAAGASSG